MGHSWIYLSWIQDEVNSIISNYQVNYSYIGECTEIGREIHTRNVSGSDVSFNITGLQEEYYFQLRINLTAINSAGRSPPNTAYAATRATGKKHMTVTVTLNS